MICGWILGHETHAPGAMSGVVEPQACVSDCSVQPAALSQLPIRQAEHPHRERFGHVQRGHDRLRSRLRFDCPRFLLDSAASACRAGDRGLRRTSSYRLTSSAIFIGATLSLARFALLALLNCRSRSVLFACRSNGVFTREVAQYIFSNVESTCCSCNIGRSDRMLSCTHRDAS